MNWWHWTVITLLCLIIVLQIVQLKIADEPKGGIVQDALHMPITRSSTPRPHELLEYLQRHHVTIGSIDEFVNWRLAMRSITTAGGQAREKTVADCAARYTSHVLIPGSAEHWSIGADGSAVEVPVELAAVPTTNLGFAAMFKDKS